MKTLYTIKARSPFVWEESIDFYSDGARYRITFDRQGNGTIDGEGDIPAAVADAVRAFDPDGREYVLAEAVPYVPEKTTDEDEPAEPAKKPAEPAEPAKDGEPAEPPTGEQSDESTEESTDGTAKVAKAKTTTKK